MGRFQGVLAQYWRANEGAQRAVGQHFSAHVGLLVGLDPTYSHAGLQKARSIFGDVPHVFAFFSTIAYADPDAELRGAYATLDLTLPPGAACMLASIYALMSGLTLGFQKRRVSKAVREDLVAISDLLQLNMGRGYFSYDQFSRAPDVWTDASKSARYTGGGYVSRCGAFRWWRYGSSAARQPIDFLEGDAVVLCVEDLGPGWYRCVVPIHLDNTSFERSATKGRSRAQRLNDLLRRLFALSLKFECIFEFHWLSTHDNVHADALSREGGEQWFWDHVYEDQIWLPGPARRHPQCGHSRCLGKGESSDVAGDHPRKTAPEFVMAVAFPRASVFDGLPAEMQASVQSLSLIHL